MVNVQERGIVANWKKEKKTKGNYKDNNHN
jgi:hypothetical protein